MILLVETLRLQRNSWANLKREGDPFSGCRGTRDDTIEVKFPTDSAQVTKRGTLAKIARVYEPLGLVAPMMLSRKLLYRDACELKVAWDAQLPSQLATKWSRWEAQLPVSVSIPRTIPQHREEISNIALHCFGDTSGQGVSAAVYGIISQPSSDSVGLIAAKARLAKQGLTIPWLELVSGHMATNLITNVNEALEGFQLERCSAGWIAVLRYIGSREPGVTSSS